MSAKREVVIAWQKVATEASARWEATLQRLCDAFYAAAPTYGAMMIIMACPKVNAQLVLRHLRYSANPMGRATYMIQQRRLGRRVPLLEARPSA